MSTTSNTGNLNITSRFVVPGFYPVYTAEKKLRKIVVEKLGHEPGDQDCYLFLSKNRKELRQLFWLRRFSGKVYYEKPISDWPNSGPVIPASETVLEELMLSFRAFVKNITGSDVMQSSLDIGA
jgi:hypothetical protein